MNAGEQIVYASAWAAMTCYFATLFALVALREADGRMMRARRLWTVGWLLLLAHIAAAFHFAHHWSHAEAAASTDFQAELETGWPIRGGIYFNYVFALLWTLDVAWWWLKPQRYAARPRVVTRIIYGFLFFMVFNAVVVFGHGWIRWLGAAACLVLVVVMASRSRRSSVA